jgi:hypothetical protein
MGQRVLAENAGVETVRYTLPNKHYIAVDMDYIGVDNTTPYVNLRLMGQELRQLLFEGTILFLEMSSASCCGAEDDGGATGVDSFLDRCPVPSSSVMQVANQLTPPFLLLFHPFIRSFVRSFISFLFFTLGQTQRCSPRWMRQGKMT